MTTTLREEFAAAWPQAVATWGATLRLHEPDLLPGTSPSDRGGALAWFALDDTTVSVDLNEVERLGLGDLALPILAHEVGHHVLAPASRAEAARLRARVHVGLGDRPEHGLLVANLWSDTLINDRLRRAHRLPMDEVYRRTRDEGRQPAHWALWMRVFELLWSLPSGTLAAGDPVLPDSLTESDLQRDAWLMARHTRVFASDPVGGAGGFAAVLRPWLPATTGRTLTPCGGQADTALDDEQVPGLDGLGDPVLHPAMDPRVNPEAPAVDTDATPAEQPVRQGAGQGFGPAELTDLYAALGSTRDAAVDLYLARARRHLVAFPVREHPRAVDTEPQGWQTWEVGDDLPDVDWLASVVRSPVVVPGLTTVQRVSEPDPDPPGDAVPLDLDLYVDCSGSMPDPRAVLSPVALAGAVLALSAIRIGGAVQVTVWSGPGQVHRTGGFVRDEVAVVTALLTYLGGGTSFPLRHLAADHPAGRVRGPFEHPVHLCCISDSGVTSMFGTGQPPELAPVAHTALEAAGGGGTLVLNEEEARRAAYVAIAGHYAVHCVPQLDDLVHFARTFAQRTWGTSRLRQGAMR